MKKLLFIFCSISFLSCKTPFDNDSITIKSNDNDSLFTIAFGSCDNQKIKNELWSVINQNKPSVWIWGGDNIYSDTDDMKVLQNNYKIQKQDPEYLKFVKNKIIIGTWDDHDYGANDGGEEYKSKRESQQLFLDFIDVPKNALQRKRDGVYTSKTIITNGIKLKIIVLDSRFFRTTLTKATDTTKRFQPNNFGQGTLLGNDQWKWLENELQTSEANFNVIVSSIQFLSNKHGFESWGNFPHEVNKLEQMIVSTKAKGTFLISGDRHISTFSSKNIDGLPYPLIDFTSSGLTHSYKKFSGEENPYQKGEVVKDISFGLLKFDFKNNKVIMEIRGEENKLLQQFSQNYPPN